MKKTIIFIIFILIYLTMAPVVLAQTYGNPFPMIHSLQNEVNSLNNIVQPMIDMRGCWDIVGKGSVAIFSSATTYQFNYLNQIAGVIFLDVDTQLADGSFSGKLYRYDNYPDKSSGLVTIPVNGNVIGSTFSLYTTANEYPQIKSDEEYRYLTGSLMADGTLIGMGSSVRHFVQPLPNGYWQYTSSWQRLTRFDDCP
jgi:hypothetical protein